MKFPKKVIDAIREMKQEDRMAERQRLEELAAKIAPGFVIRHLDTIAGILAVLPDDEAEAQRRIDDLREAFWMEVQGVANEVP